MKTFRQSVKISTVSHAISLLVLVREPKLLLFLVIVMLYIFHLLFLDPSLHGKKNNVFMCMTDGWTEQSNKNMSG